MEQEFDKCDWCVEREGVMYGPSGSYAMICEECADEANKRFAEKNPKAPCEICGSVQNFPKDLKFKKCITCIVRGI